MDDQPFAYFQHPQQFDSYSAPQYPTESFGSDYPTNDGNPFVDHSYVGTPVQGGAQGWSASFPATEDAAPFQRGGGVSDGASEHPRPEIGAGGRPGRLRLDVNIGNGSEPRVQETANLASPLDLRPQHPDSAITSAYPARTQTYDASSTSPTFGMNRDRSSSGLSLSLTMPPDPTYFMGMYNQQLPPPQSAPPVYPGQPMAHRHHQQYAPSRSPQSHLHSLSAPPYGSSTPRIGLSIPYTPSSIASSSVRSASPASTAATSAPLDFSSLASPSGEQEVGIGEYALPASSLSSLSLAVGSPHSPTAPRHSPTVLTAGQPHSFVSVARPSSGPDRAPTNGHSASPIRRRAGKQRLDDARRKEICTYARDRPKARQEDIALKYGVERSTISKILKNKDKWLTMDTHTRKPMPVKHRPSKFPEIETELLKWVKECQENGIGITDTRIKVKARECAKEIGLPDGKFKASSGWIENFKVRNSLTKRSQDEQEASPTNEERDDVDQMDEDDDAPIQASQSTQIDDGDGYEADLHGRDSFNPFASLSTQVDSALAPPETSFSTFSTDSVASGSQDLSLFLSGTPMSSNASSFASSPSGAMPRHAPSDAGMRSRGHSHSIAMRAMGPSCTPSGSPQSGASPVQPASPARLDMRLVNTPTSASLPRFPSPLSSSTSASANPLVLVHNARHTPVSQNHSRHPSDASGFSYDGPPYPSADMPNGFGQHMFHVPTSCQALDALDTVLTFFQRPQAAEIVSPPERMTFEAVRARLADRMLQAHQLQASAANNASDGQ
ncbi:hypothetical protein FRC10_009501 [Ceratobasidium sp. 414]|nr:hypothetical protein FRC10_009501 [Ceratobasidium sp. 414]